MTSRDFGRFLTPLPLVTRRHKKSDPLKYDVTMVWPRLKKTLHLIATKT